MLSLYSFGEAQPTTAATAPSTATSSPTTAIKPPIVQKIQVSALTGWNALLLGIVTGFAMAAGTMMFDKLAKRAHWK